VFQVAAVACVAIFVLAAYIVIDAEHLVRGFLRLLPPRQRGVAVDLGQPVLDVVPFVGSFRAAVLGHLVGVERLDGAGVGHEGSLHRNTTRRRQNCSLRI
jgi:hypothetical protein